MTSPNDYVRRITSGTAKAAPIEIAFVTAKTDKSDAWFKLLAGIGGVFLNAWFLMLGFDAANSLWPSVPAAGFWACLLLRLGLTALFACVSSSRTLRSSRL